MVRKSSSAGNRPQTKRKPGTVRERFRKLRLFQSQGQAELTKLAGLSACAVWYCLWAAEDAASGRAVIGRRRLAALLGCDERTVRRHLQALIKSGYLERAKLGVKGRTASTYRLHPLPITVSNEGTNLSPQSGDKPVPPFSKSGDISVRKQVASVSPTQVPTEPISGGPADGSASRHDVPLRFPVGDPPESSAPERQTPLAWLAEAIRRAGGTMPGAEASRLADRPGGPGFRAINRVLENLKPDDGINSTFDGGKLVLTLSEA